MKQSAGAALISARKGGPATGDLEVSPGDKISAVYVDALRADGAMIGVDVKAGGTVAP